mgnify:CR=1 FL=1
MPGKERRKPRMKGKKLLCLSDIVPGEKAYVEKIGSETPDVSDSVVVDAAMRKRLMDIGLIKGTEVECVGESPLGDPRAYLIRDAVIAIRRTDGCGIYVSGGDGT